MPGIDLGADLEPVDPEERRRYHALVAKLVTMPDGQKRIISIEHWYWVCMEFFDDEYGMDLDYILEKMVKIFGSEDDFDELLPHHIRLSVSALISKIIAEEDGLANVEWYRLDNTQ